MSKAKSEPQESRSFRLSTADDGAYREIRDTVLRLTRELERPTLRSLTLGEIRTKMFSINVDVFPDGQRGVVADFEWMKSLVTTIANSQAVLDPLLVNQVGERFHVYKGKQRMSALFAFFTGLVPAEIDGVDRYWTDHRNPPEGWGYLFDKNNVNSNGKRETAREPSEILRLWADKITASDRTEKRFRTEKRVVFREVQKEKFLRKVLDFQVLPAWPPNAVAMQTAWSEMNCFKHSGTECMYSLPGLGALKEVEGSISRFGAKFGIENESKRVFCDILRAYMFLCDSDQFIPFARDVDNYGTIICEVAADFINTNKTSNAALKAIDILAEGARLLAKCTELKGDNSSKVVTSFSSDTFACLLILASRKKGERDFNKAIHIFRSSAKVKLEELGHANYHLWSKGEREGNFALLVRAVLARLR